MPLPVPPDMLVVSEIVSPTLVGDGPLAGWRCAVIRLGGCNLACTWCDVPDSWDGSRVELQVALVRRLVRNILEEALSSSPRLVVITGGEPLLQQRSPGWAGMLEFLNARNIESEIHTNGTLVPTAETADLAHRFVVSPKLSHSGEPTWTRLRPDALRAWADLAATGKVAFSFVVRDRMDVQTVASLAGIHSIPSEIIWISPEGSLPSRISEVTTDVTETVLLHGFNLAPRISPLSVSGSLPV
ncbi:MAG: 7-carboxy-7-deazaguanine synthase [Actinomycetota bacterium]|nr:7-carboxy-7-deazaguanine synthase [Actinomycetota bacterium]